MWEKLKGELITDRSYYAVLIVLVGLSAFALGRYAVVTPSCMLSRDGGEAAAAAVSLTYTSGEAATATRSMTPERAFEGDVVSGAFVASRSGTKYHDVRCASARRIAEANRVYFPTEAAARAAGYTPASTCPLLSR
jgi:hypothetical protein